MNELEQVWHERIDWVSVPAGIERTFPAAGMRFWILVTREDFGVTSAGRGNPDRSRHRWH
jgi:hypothetical protein